MTVTFFTASQIDQAGLGGAHDVRGWEFGFPFGGFWISESLGGIDIDFAALLGDLVIWLVFLCAVEIVRRRIRTWQFSLARLLVAVMLLSFACGCIRLASVNGIQLALVPGVLALGIAIGLIIKHVLIGCAIVVLLAVVSSIPTETLDGCFQPAEIRLSVHDQFHQPVAGACFNVRAARTLRSPNRRLVLEYDKLPLATDSSGCVVFHQMGYRFSNTGWHLFWCVPIGWNSPEFRCYLTRDGYSKVELPFSSLFDPNARLPDTIVLTVDGQPLNLPVYSHTTLMCRK